MIPDIDMKTAFKRDMKFIYPEGVDNLIQHRDLVRIYAMGWASALIAIKDIEAVREWVKQFETESKDPKWMPDLSWEWTLDDLT